MIPADKLLSMSKNLGYREVIGETKVPILTHTIDEIQDLFLNVVNALNNGKAVSKGYYFFDGGLLSDDVIGALKVAGYYVYFCKFPAIALTFKGAAQETEPFYTYSTCVEWKKNSAKKILKLGEYTEL